MGNINSIQSDYWWSSTQKMTEPNPTTSNSTEINEDNTTKLNEFKLELARKHEKRREILAEKRKQMVELREEVLNLRRENQDLKNNVIKNNGSSESEKLKCDEDIQRLQNENDSLRNHLKQKEDEFNVNLIDIQRLRDDNENLRNQLIKKEEEKINYDELAHKNKQLKMDIAQMQKELQHLNTEILDFEKERQDYQTHVVALKDVIAVSKQMLQIREAQLKELRHKIEIIEETLAGREMNILSQDLRNEYERQLQNIRHLRTLYEERQRSDRREKQEMIAKLEQIRKELQSEKDKENELLERIESLEAENSKKYDEIKNLESNLGLSNAECRQYQSELHVINQLFSEILLGFNNSQDIDLDSLTKQLVEHHDLLQNIVVNEVSTEVSSALPKVLLDLLKQVNHKKNKNETELETIEEEENEDQKDKNGAPQMNSVEEIVENLPKVWRVLIELLSHQKAPQNNLTDNEDSTETNPCYKVVQTPKGPNLVLSVSQTFIRLKDLILEKKSLEKETNHLKQLNTHLENRLQDQEKRLEMVSSELSKTWHVVGKMQKQHELLHTQEKILRYELAQKRKLLTDLKEELEYSREKWQQAREKNSNTEEQWKQLRKEFAARRKTISEDPHSSSSVESGYSDERECSSSDDDEERGGYDTDASDNHKISTCEEEQIELGKQTNHLCKEYTDIKNQKGQVSDSLDDQEEKSAIKNDHETEKNRLESDNHDCIVHESNFCENQIESNESTFEISESSSEAKTSFEKTSSQTQEAIVREEIHSTLKTDNESEKTNLSTNEAQPVLNEDSEKPKSALNEESGKPKPKTFDELMAARDERLKRLEGQCQQLVRKVTNTTNKSVAIVNKLDNLHEVYGEGSGNSEETATESRDQNEE